MHESTFTCNWRHHHRTTKSPHHIEVPQKFRNPHIVAGYIPGVYKPTHQHPPFDLHKFFVAEICPSFPPYFHFLPNQYHPHLYFCYYISSQQVSKAKGSKFPSPANTYRTHPREAPRFCDRVLCVWENAQ